MCLHTQSLSYQLSLSPEQWHKEAALHCGRAYESRYLVAEEGLSFTGGWFLQEPSYRNGGLRLREWVWVEREQWV